MRRRTRLRSRRLPSRVAATVWRPRSGSLARGRSALRLKVERLAGPQVETARSLAYDYSWTVRNFAQLGWSVGMRSVTEQAIAVLEPSFGLTWRAQF
jgi:hypothetical protein